MKVKFIHYYFLININDVPVILKQITPPPIPTPLFKYGQNYTVLHTIKKHLTILYLDNLLHMPLVGTGAGQVIV